jgi:hypothetical protein
MLMTCQMLKRATIFSAVPPKYADRLLPSTYVVRLHLNWQAGLGQNKSSVGTRLLTNSESGDGTAT